MIVTTHNITQKLTLPASQDSILSQMFPLDKAMIQDKDRTEVGEELQEDKYGACFELS